LEGAAAARIVGARARRADRKVGARGQGPAVDHAIDEQKRLVEAVMISTADRRRYRQADESTFHEFPTRRCRPAAMQASASRSWHAPCGPTAATIVRREPP
jgi:hypothetical protein